MYTPEQLADWVRATAQSRGLDLVTDAGAVRSLVADAVADHVDESDLAASDLAIEVYARVAPFGPLQEHLDDPEVEELWINEPGRVFVARSGRSELTATILTAEAVRDLVERMLRSTGRRVDLSSPFVDASLPDGSRLHVVIPDITRQHWSVNVRKFVVRARHVDDLVRLGTLPADAAEFLAATVRAGLNIIVAGGTQAGKTTMLNALLGCVPSGERVITCEETFELQVDLADWVAMQTRQASLEGTGEVRLRRLVKEALRMRPTRLVVGEVRQEEALDLLLALNSGMPGMCSIHANSAREAVAKLCTLPLLAGENVSAAFVTPTVAAVVDIVVHVETTPDGSRRVSEIIALPGRTENGVVVIAELFVSDGLDLVRGMGYPPHADRFARAGIDLAALLDSPPLRVA